MKNCLFVYTTSKIEIKIYIYKDIKNTQLFEIVKISLSRKTKELQKVC